MGKFVRGMVILGVIAGVGLTLLKRAGLLSSGECSPSCACSRGATECTCGHATCLTPV